MQGEWGGRGKGSGGTEARGVGTNQLWRIPELLVEQSKGSVGQFCTHAPA